MHKIGSMGHTFGVRVHRVQKVQRVQRVVVAASPQIKKGGRGSAAGCVEGLWKKVLKIDRPLAGGFVSLTALRAEGCGLPLCGNAYKVSVTELAFCVI